MASLSPLPRFDAHVASWTECTALALWCLTAIGMLVVHHSACTVCVDALEHWLARLLLRVAWHAGVAAIAWLLLPHALEHRVQPVAGGGAMRYVGVIDLFAVCRRAVWQNALAVVASVVALWLGGGIRAAACGCDWLLALAGVLRGLAAHVALRWACLLVLLFTSSAHSDMVNAVCEQREASLAKHKSK